MTDTAGHRTMPSTGGRYPLSIKSLAGNVDARSADGDVYEPATGKP